MTELAIRWRRVKRIHKHSIGLVFSKEVIDFFEQLVKDIERLKKQKGWKEDVWKE